MQKSHHGSCNKTLPVFPPRSLSTMSGSIPGFVLVAEVVDRSGRGVGAEHDTKTEGDREGELLGWIATVFVR